MVITEIEVIISTLRIAISRLLTVIIIHVTVVSIAIAGIGIGVLLAILSIGSVTIVTSAIGVVSIQVAVTPLVVAFDVNWTGIIWTDSIALVIAASRVAISISISVAASFAIAFIAVFAIFILIFVFVFVFLFVLFIFADGGKVTLFHVSSNLIDGGLIQIEVFVVIGFPSIWHCVEDNELQICIIDSSFTRSRRSTRKKRKDNIIVIVEKTNEVGDSVLSSLFDLLQKSLVSLVGVRVVGELVFDELSCNRSEVINSFRACCSLFAIPNNSVRVCLEDIDDHFEEFWTSSPTERLTR